MKSPENSILSSGCKPLDEPTFRRELTRLYPDCTAFARKLTRDRERAADAVQDAMLAALTGSSRPVSLEATRPWLLTVIKRRVFSAGSGAASERGKVDDLKTAIEVFGLDRAAQPDERLDALAVLHSRPASQQRDILKALAGSEIRVTWPRPVHEEATRDLLRRHHHTLSEAQRDAISLVVLDGLGLKAAGNALGITKEAVRDRLTNAIAAARRIERGEAIAAPTCKTKPIASKRPRRLPDIPRWPVLRRGAFGAIAAANANTVAPRSAAQA